MKRKGRPVLGAIAGFFFGLLAALDLMMFEVRPIDTLATAFPLIGLAVGIAGAYWAPFGKRDRDPQAGSAPPPGP